MCSAVQCSAQIMRATTHTHAPRTVTRERGRGSLVDVADATLPVQLLRDVHGATVLGSAACAGLDLQDALDAFSRCHDGLPQDNEDEDEDEDEDEEQSQREERKHIPPRATTQNKNRKKKRNDNNRHTTARVCQYNTRKNTRAGVSRH